MHLSKLQERYPNCVAFKFGDNKELCDELFALAEGENENLEGWPLDH